MFKSTVFDFDFSRLLTKYTIVPITITIITSIMITIDATIIVVMLCDDTDELEVLVGDMLGSCDEPFKTESDNDIH